MALLFPLQTPLDGESYVDLIASGYEWICPNCENLNNEIEVTLEVRCSDCKRTFRTHPPEHAYE